MKETLQALRSIWRLRDVWLILPARTLVLAGNALAFVTLLLRVHDQTGEPWAIAALIACFALPAIATMGIAGHLADRHDARVLLAAGLGVQLVAAIGLALDDRLATTYLLVCLYEAGQSLVSPVWSGLLPRVVGEDRLGQAVAWQQGLGAIAGPLGGALGGLSYQWWGARAAFLGTAACLVVLVASGLAVRTRRAIAHERPDEVARRARVHWLAGVRIVRADGLLWPLFLGLLAMVVLVEGVNTGEIFLARDVLGATPAQYGLGEVAGGIGGVVGAALAGRLAGDRGQSLGTLAGFGLACAAILGAGLAPSFWVYLCLVVVLAAAAGVGNAASGALIMRRTPDADRGKVQAGLSGLARTATLIALALGGTVVTFAGPRFAFVLAGAGGLFVVWAAWWRFRGRTDMPVGARGAQRGRQQD